jgi:hypothetical protein
MVAHERLNKWTGLRQGPDRTQRLEAFRPFANDVAQKVYCITSHVGLETSQQRLQL